MKKVLVEIYHTYGKNSGDELVDSFLIDDTKECRQNVLDEWGHGECLENEDYFIDGNNDYISYYLDGGDWDDPTGREIHIVSYEEKLMDIEETYEKELAKLNKLFKK